ncbi:MAG: hypothetical protein JWN70_6360 [Planctomycetaceae bacterium]|nr:hypothetical protein [Planctomycetaceae bacterium]
MLTSGRGPVVAAMLAFTAVAGQVLAEDWPQWRGPRRNAVSQETGLLRSWPEGGPRVVWQASGVGSGFSSVVVSRGLVFTMGKQEADVIVSAIQADTGKTAWTRKIGTTQRNPCSTPTVDDDRLYALDPDGELVCLNSLTGDILWQRSFLEDFAGRMMSGRGYGESPLVDGENLICTPGGPDAALVSLNKRTGEVVWKSKLPELGSAGRDGAGFSSIVPLEVAGVRQYVQLVGRGVIGVAAADGRFLWGFNSIANGTANIPTPVVRDDLVFAANGYNAGSVLLQIVPEAIPPGSPPAFKAKVVYELTSSQFQNHHGGVVLVGDRLFGGHGNNNGLPTCLDFKTGEILWKRRGPGVGSAAVVYADGHLCFRYQNGLVALIAAADSGYQLNGTLEVPGAGGDSWAHPVIANSRLYLREQDTLWVYDLKREQKDPATIETIPAFAASKATFKALLQLGISVEPLRLPATRPVRDSAQRPVPVAADKARRLYRYAVAPDAPEKSEPPVIVSLTRKNLTPEGTFSQDFVDLLKQSSGSLVLNLAGTQVSAAGLEQLQTCPQIMGLNLELCSHVDDAALAYLPLLKQLRVLILTGTGITGAGLRSLIPLAHLTALDLEVCDGITDEACETLGMLRQLRALVVKKTGFEKQMISDAGLQHLKPLVDLELLNLYGNKITDAGLVHLEGFSKLRELNLSLLAITDKGLVHLKSLSQLEHLELLYSVGFSGPTITNGGIAPLSSLTNLTSLNLTGSRMTDAGLEQLQGLKKLSTLLLVHTGVSANGIKVFQAAVPGCVVIKEGK